MWSMGYHGNPYLNGCFPGKIYVGVSKNRGTPKGWFIMENRIKMDDLGVPLFSWQNIWMFPKIVVPPNHPS